MATKQYRTKQKDLILHCLQQMPEQHVCADDIVQALREQGEDVGTATVYRNLDKLVKEGVLLKYTLPDGLKACYQYDSCSHHHLHCHVICTGCGEVEHLQCSEVDSLASHLLASHGFELDKQKTVLYGLCEKCAVQIHTGE